VQWLRWRLALGAVGVVTALLLTTALSSAASEHFNQPLGTTVTGALKDGTTVKLAGTIDHIAVTFSCKTVGFDGKTPATGLTLTLSAAPTFAGCKDNLGGTDTVAANAANGSWTLTEASTGDKMTLSIPKAGVTLHSSLLNGCTIILAPSAAAGVTDTYTKHPDDITWALDGKSIPVSGDGCTVGDAMKISGTLILTPAIYPVS
jgi:hypothetical protein